jgi:hypothetical protein
VADTRLLTLAALLPASCLLAACAGNGQGLDQGGRPITPGSSGGPLVATFQSIQENVFTPICTVCHAGAAAPQGLRLDNLNSYAMLVGVPSAEASSVLRVKAGDPDNSYIIQKLEGHAAVGARMPLGGPYLPNATIMVIRQWITDGAQPPPPAAGLGFSLAAVSPAPFDVLGAAPLRVVMAFSGEVDQTRLASGSLLLERLSAGAAESVAGQLGVPAGNPRALLFEPLQPLAPGHYRLSMPANPGTALAGTSGAGLAGTAASGEPTAITDFEVTSAP